MCCVYISFVYDINILWLWGITMWVHFLVFFLTVFLNVESQVCRLLHLTEVMHVLCVYMWVCVQLCIGVQVCMPLHTHTEARGILLYHPLPYALETSSHSLSLELAWQPVSPSNPPASAVHRTGVTVEYTARSAFRMTAGSSCLQSRLTEPSPQPWFRRLDSLGQRASPVLSSWLIFWFYSL